MRALGRKAWADGSDPVVFIAEHPLAAIVQSDDLQTLDPSRLDPAAFAAREELRNGGGFQLREILEAIRRAFPCERLRVADRGLREGMLVEMMRADGAWDGHR